MGGLSKYMPTTYKTMLVAWLAICGIIPFAGFWSKDEILGKTFSSIYGGGKILWVVGFFTAAMTAFYMTRLIAMTFWGEERFRKIHGGGEADEAFAAEFDKGEHGHDAVVESAGDRPHHRPGEHVGPRDVTDRQAQAGIPHKHFEPHESPSTMTLPLIVLAVFSAVVGLLGIPRAFPALVGSKANINVIERWLDPVIVNPNKPYVPGDQESPAVSAEGLSGAAASKEAQAPETAAEGVSATEYLLMILSLAIAIGGIYLGRVFYLNKPDLPKIWAQKLKPLYQLSRNKWYWDWLLDDKGVEAAKAVNNGLFAVDADVVDGGVNGAGWFTRFSAWLSGLFDKYVVDLAVNAVGWITRAFSVIFRSFQTGFWQNYALIFTLGLFVTLFLYERHAIPSVMEGFVRTVKSLFGSQSDVQ